MSDTILIRGFTASDPALSTLPNGVPVKAYRRLAQNIATSIEKGQPLVVSGRQRISRWNREDGTQGTTVEVDALGIGHDLNYGTSTFVRTVEKRTVNEGAMQGSPQQYASAQEAPQYAPQYAPPHAPQQNAEALGVTAQGAPAQNGGAQSDEPPF